MSARKPLISFGGGKGGVGKSFLAVNAAIHLSSIGLRTALIDADFGGANLHTLLGMELPRTTLWDYIEKKSELSTVMIGTSHRNLWLGAGIVRDFAAGLKQFQKTRLIKALRSMDFDVIIVDLGAGTSSHVIDIFAASDFGILVTLPEPTAIENCYRFLKTAFYRHLRGTEKIHDAKVLLDSTIAEKSSQKGPIELIGELMLISPEAGGRYIEELDCFRPAIVVNQARTVEDRNLTQSIASVLKRFYGFKSWPLGEIAYDDSVWLSVRNRVPLISLSPLPDTQAARDTSSVCMAIGELVSEFRTMR